MILELQRRVNELDAAVTKDGARAGGVVDADDGGCHLIGNRNRKGYLRAGIDLLRAASVPLEGNNYITPVHASDLADKTSVSIRSWRRTEDFAAARISSRGSRPAG